MALTFTITGPGSTRTVPIRQAVFRRGLGRRPAWTCRAPVTLHEESQSLETVAWALRQHDPLKGALAAEDREVMGELRLCWADVEEGSGGHRSLVLVAEPASAALAQRAGTPRRRIVQAADLAALAATLGVQVPDDHLGTILQQASFPPRDVRAAFRLPGGRSAYLVQDGLTDVELLLGCLSHCRLQWFLAEQPQRLSTHLALSAKGEHLYLARGNREFLQAAPAFEQTLAGEGSWLPQPVSLVPDEVYFEPGGGPCPAVTFTKLHGPWDRFPEDWKTWLAWSLPSPVKQPGLDGGAALIVHQAEEVLSSADDAASTLWATRLIHLPRGLPTPCRPTLPGWQGFGKVIDYRSAEGKAPWVRVKLLGFQAEKKGNLAEALLEPAYTGLDGASGLHLTPEPGTLVDLSWTGRPGEPLVCTGNPRVHAPARPAPSLTLGAVWTVEAGEVAVRGRQGVRLHGGNVQLELKDGHAKGSKEGGGP